jgi:hypothetical protein
MEGNQGQETDSWRGLIARWTTLRGNTEVRRR